MREGFLGEGKLGRREGNTKWSQPVIQIGNGIPQDSQKDKDSQLTTFWVVGWWGSQVVSETRDHEDPILYVVTLYNQLFWHSAKALPRHIILHHFVDDGIECLVELLVIFLVNLISNHGNFVRDAIWLLWFPIKPRNIVREFKSSSKWEGSPSCMYPWVPSWLAETLSEGSLTLQPALGLWPHSTSSSLGWVSSRRAASDCFWH